MSKLRQVLCVQTGSARRAFAALIVVATCVWAAAAGADDWPQWQGPDRNSMSGERGLLHVELP